METERRTAVTDLRLSGAQRLLDVACGPGNFTRSLSESLSADGGAVNCNTDGLAVGFDISGPMLRRAVVDNPGPMVAYARGDASRLPFAPGTFDAVCCFGALYLMPEPVEVLREMVRVLAPGGRIAVMTSYPGAHGPRRHAVGAVGQLVGVRMFERDTVPDLFADAGLVEIEQRLRGVVQYVNATKPAA
ncbi:MAG: class I SAM-dependent methyltransferase, partial [Aldersonia sp.]|nr:class I SAM-dependent methyltransferase [Aldersonia sp.]